MSPIDRRKLLRNLSLAGTSAAVHGLLPAWARAAPPALNSTLQTVSGNEIRLVLDRARWPVDGKSGNAITINGTLPGPVIRLKEGQTVKLIVQNNLDEESSIHWHGLLVPFQMDGVPGVTFPGIPAKTTFEYQFEVKQSGTYWYHSHSGLQEQEGLYGPIIIEPRDADSVSFDRDYVVMLSDFSFFRPETLFKRIKQQAGVFNYQRQTLSGLLRGKDQTLAERIEWAKMLMDPTDISDITGAVYTFLINGHGPKDNWTGLFSVGERVRLRFINAGAQMVFNVRIPGLKMTVVAGDGQYVRPVDVDEFQIANAETYDVIVEPMDDKAYTIVSEAVDRSGMGVATLAPRAGMSAPVPPLRERPLATMKDMGMDMSSMTMGSMGGEGNGVHDMSMPMDHGSMNHASAATSMHPPGMAPPKPRGSDVMGDMGGMEMSMRDPANAPQVKMGPGVQSITAMPLDRTGETGQGLESVGHRVLVYKDLVALHPNPDSRTPSRALEIHLTGNMERFMWGFDGKKFTEATGPYTFMAGERVRVTLVNDTMMAHPIHLHGHFFDLVTGAPNDHKPRKHTVTVLPGGKVSWDFTAETGDWAFHCHMLYHMHAGMFQVFAVRPHDGGAQ